MREYLLPSVFLSSAASHFLSLSSSLVARRGSKMRERAPLRLLVVPLVPFGWMDERRSVEFS